MLTRGVATSVKPSFLSHPLCLGLVITVLISGHVMDCVATYIAQPHFELEANVFHRFLVVHGASLTWPLALLLKAIVCGVGVFGFRRFVRSRATYYPSSARSWRELGICFLYGRRLTLLESYYSPPRSAAPSVFFVCALVAMSGPSAALAAYANLASKYNWYYPSRRWGSAFFGIDPLMICCVLLPIVWLGWQIWRDFLHFSAQHDRDCPAS